MRSSSYPGSPPPDQREHVSSPWVDSESIVFRLIGREVCEERRLASIIGVVATPLTLAPPRASVSKPNTDLPWSAPYDAGFKCMPADSNLKPIWKPEGPSHRKSCPGIGYVDKRALYGARLQQDFSFRRHALARSHPPICTNVRPQRTSLSKCHMPVIARLRMSPKPRRGAAGSFTARYGKMVS